MTQTHDNSENESADLGKPERLAIEAVGRVIDFWGFKHNQGRIWAYLYVVAEPQSQKQIQQALELSKGATSMLMKELRRWGIIAKSRPKHQRPAKFEAEDDFLRMIQNVFEEREKQFVIDINKDLQEASQLVIDREEHDQTSERILKIATLSELFTEAFLQFLEEGYLDLSSTADALAGET